MLDCDSINFTSFNRDKYDLNLKIYLQGPKNSFATVYFMTCPVEELHSKRIAKKKKKTIEAYNCNAVKCKELSYIYGQKSVREILQKTFEIRNF